MTSLGFASACSVRSKGLVWWVALVLLCVVLLLPLLVVDVPPLLDYPNHLARAFVLASLPDDAVLAKFYAPHWTIIPNLALDLVAPPLMRILPVHVAGRLCLAVAVLLPVLGTIAYNTALGGRWWSFGVGLLAYHYCLLLGFLNFAFSIGLALLLAAAWLRWRNDRPMLTIGLTMLGALAVFACHLMGLVFLGILITAAELSSLYQQRYRATLQRAAVLALVFTAPAALYLASSLHGLGGDAEFMAIRPKLLQLLTSFVNYNWQLDMTTAVVAIAMPAIGLMFRWGFLPRPAAIAMVVLAIVFLAAPYAWKGTYLLDTRLATMLGFMLFAGFVPGPMPRTVRVPAVIVLGILFAARMTLLTNAWAAHRADIADLRSVLAPVQPGQAVFVAEAAVKEAPAYWDANPNWRKLSDGVRLGDHLGALVLIERRAYWPFQFDIPSQQPIETLEPYRALAGQVGYLPNWAETAKADVCGFDYVLLLEADSVPDLPANRFRPVARAGFAALYAINQCHPKASRNDLSASQR